MADLTDAAGLDCLRRTHPGKRLTPGANASSRSARPRCCACSGDLTLPSGQAEWATAEAHLRRASGRGRMTRDEIASLVTTLGDLRAVIREADPTDKSRGLPPVRSSADLPAGNANGAGRGQPRSTPWGKSCPRGESNHNPTAVRAGQRPPADWRIVSAHGTYTKGGAGGAAEQGSELLRRSFDPLIKSPLIALSHDAARCRRGTFSHVRSGGLLRAVSCCAAWCRRLSELSGSSRAHAGRLWTAAGLIDGDRIVRFRATAVVRKSTWPEDLRSSKSGICSMQQSPHTAAS
jgi:hypothetical protein